jgi:ABC-2 type transport system ATP-binding protein
VRFRTAKGDDALAGLLAELVSSGLRVTQFREVQTDLEEAFMTAARVGDAEAAAALEVAP